MKEDCNQPAPLLNLPPMFPFLGLDIVILRKIFHNTNSEPNFSFPNTFCFNNTTATCHTHSSQLRKKVLMAIYNFVLSLMVKKGLTLKESDSTSSNNHNKRKKFSSCENILNSHGPSNTNAVDIRQGTCKKSRKTNINSCA